MPEATTRMSRPPCASTAACTIAWQSASLFGRRATAPSRSARALGTRSASTLELGRVAAAMIVSWAPAAPSVAHATCRSAPVAPTTSADLPATSNSADGIDLRQRHGAPWRVGHHHQHGGDHVAAFLHLPGSRPRDEAAVELAQHVTSHRSPRSIVTSPLEHDIDLLERRASISAPPPGRK